MNIHMIILLLTALLLTNTAIGEDVQIVQERQKLREQWNQFEKELQEDVYSLLDGENKTPEECQYAFQKMEEILDKEESFAKQHHEYYDNLLQDVICCLNERLDKYEKAFHKCEEILNNIIYTKTENGFLCPWDNRRLALRVLTHFSMISDNPDFKKKILANRAKMVEAYLLTWKEFKEKFPPELDAEMKKLLKDWDDYYHSEEYPEFNPVYVGRCNPKYPWIRPPECIKDVEKRPEYEKYLNGYEKATLYFWGEKNRNKTRAKYPDNIIKFTTKLYSEPPFATDELKEIMKKNNLEKNIQKEILREVNKAEKEAKKAKKKSSKSKTKKAKMAEEDLDE